MMLGLVAADQLVVLLVSAAKVDKVTDLLITVLVITGVPLAVWLSSVVLTRRRTAR